MLGMKAAQLRPKGSWFDSGGGDVFLFELNNQFYIQPVFPNFKMVHLLYIPDGHRRYAREKRISYQDSYRKSAEQIKEVAGACFESNLTSEISVGLLWQYNLKRESKQIMPLARLISEEIPKLCMSSMVDENSVEVRLAGELGEFFSFAGNEAREKIEYAVRSTRKNEGNVLNLLIAYDGMSDYFRALKKCSKMHISYRKALDFMQIPPVDIMIRTAQIQGTNRLSNFFPGIDQATLVSTPFFPHEIGEADIALLLESANQQRIFEGKKKYY